MTNDELREVLATWAGIAPISLIKEDVSYPDYVNDLNAVATLEAKLPPGLIDAYIERLGRIVRAHWVSEGRDIERFNEHAVIFAIATATPEQRCRALVQVLALEK